MVLAILAGGTAAAPATSAMGASAGNLNLAAELRLASQLGACPPGASADTCAARTAEGAVPGLGSVTENYAFLAKLGPPSCAADFGKVLPYPVHFLVAGKGEIHFALAEGAECVGVELVRTQRQSFTITGGTGIYQSASGSGTVERTLGGETDTGRRGHEMWTGTLNVPGLEFDVTPPTVTGAVGKRVRAPRTARRVRVTYRVSAQDDVDGAVPVSCQPRSGSRFSIGRTFVTCSATDTSGNPQTKRFTVTVTRRR